MSSPWGEDLGVGETIIVGTNEQISLIPAFSRLEKEPNRPFRR